MSVKIAAYKKISSSEQYACSVLEVKEWADELADLRIEFGTHNKFRFPARCNQRLIIQGVVIASINIDNQLKPSLFFYPIPAAKYTEQIKKEFLEQVFNDLKKWLKGKITENEIIGQETVLIELNGKNFKMHRLLYL